MRLGYKIPVPPKRDVRAWRQLQTTLEAERGAKGDAASAAHVRLRHSLEQEIRRLDALPANPGRAKAIALLRRQLRQLVSGGS